MNVFIDLETIAGPGHMRQKIIDNIKPPGNIKKPESIERWMEENAEAVAVDKVAKLALHPIYNKIVCIGVAVGDNAVKTYSGTSEGLLLAHLIEYLKSEDVTRSNISLIGHNIEGFDLPTLRAAFMRNDIKQRFMPFPGFTARRWIKDTMKIMQHQYGQFTGLGLEDLAKQFNLGSKTEGVDGSMVADMVKEEKWNELECYCAQDVEITRALYEKIYDYYY